MKTLALLFSALIILGCSRGNNGFNFPDPFDSGGGWGDYDPCNDDVVYLDTNGITVKAYPDAYAGSCGEIDGVVYLVVDDYGLRYFYQAGRDATTLVTTLVTDMSYMFQGATDFNQNIESWDVSNVTDMSYMFSGATDFNQSIEYWDVSNVIDMRNMFGGATDFNQDIGNWDVSNVNDMTEMFYDATEFNQDLSAWNVDGVTYCSGFSDFTPQWILPKPNFTNCTP